MKSAFSVLALVLLAGVLIAAPDFTGSWIGKTEVPNAGVDEITLVVQKKEAVYTGVISDMLGYLAPATELKEVKVEGNDMTFQFPLIDGTLMSAKLTFKDDALTGVWVHPEGDAAEMKLERKK